MRLLDLFCCAGGAGMGYARAGFTVVGVDLAPQPRYPFEFVQADVLALDPAWIASFDVIHASPPCQGYSDMKHAPGAVGAPLLIPQVRRLLLTSGRPYVIENVEGARYDMVEPVTLCGSMFGLGSEGHELRRHRLFESNRLLVVPPCDHSGRPIVGVYGGHARQRAAAHGGRTTRDVWAKGHAATMAEAMGIDWMTTAQMSEAIPPAYTEFLGHQLAAYVEGYRYA